MVSNWLIQTDAFIQMYWLIKVLGVKHNYTL
jgi:hypothetical protein